MLEELDGLAGEVASVGEGAKRLAERVRALPGELEAARRTLDEGVRFLQERRAASDRAAAAVTEAEAEARARREAVRAGDQVRSAKRRLKLAREEVERLESEAGRLRREVADVERRARRLAGALRERGLVGAAGEAPGDSLESVAAWTTEARAALLVARSNLAAQRDAVIRQANELGSLVLGEPLTARNPASVARLLTPDAD